LSETSRHRRVCLLLLHNNCTTTRFVSENPRPVFTYECV
jgi:hypothetical protein